MGKRVFVLSHELARRRAMEPMSICGEQPLTLTVLEKQVHFPSIFFSAFSITIDGTAIDLTPAPASADLDALAADLQSQIRNTDSTISVSVDSGNLVFSSTDLSKRISAVSLTADAAVTDAATGTRQVPPAATFLASMSDISFGSSPSVTDFKSFSVVVGGKQFNITPKPATADLSALAEDLQKQLRALDGTDDLSVTVSGAW